MITKLTSQFNRRNLLITNLLLIFLLVFQVAVSAQGKQVTGTVTDSKGETLPGVNVLIKGTTIGTITDFDGKYLINVNKESDVLVYSFVGYMDQSITVGNQSQINVVLKEDVLQLNEVVAIGYGIQKKSDLTGSVASVKAESLKSMPVTRVDDAIQGKAAGVVVLNNSGQPGAAPVIRVRGLATVNGGDPLIIIDGVSGGSLADLNPSDIESIEVLKDAASQGIYGSAGGNGVILVSTKHGKEGKIRVSFDAFAGIQQPWAKNFSISNAQEYAAIYNQYQTGTLGKAEYFPFDGTNYLDPKTNEVLTNTNWQDEIFRTAFMHNYNVSLSGGNKVSNVFFSAGYSGQEGTVLRTFQNKFTARLNSDHKITKWLTIGENLSFTSSVSSNQGERNEYGSPVATSVQMLPFVPIYAPVEADGSQNYAFKGAGLASNVTNPLAQIAYNNNMNRGTSIFGNAYLRAEIIKGLSFETRLGMNTGPSTYRSYTPAFTIGADNDPSASASLGISTFNDNVYFSNGWQWQNFLTYNFNVAKNNFSIVAGFESGKNRYGNLNKRKNDADIPDINKWEEYSDTTGFSTIQNKDVTTSGYAYFGRLTYDYAGILLLQANFRRDYSSKFGPNNRVGNFPSISAGLKFSELKFIKDLNIIDFGKIRFGYGSTGNSDIEPFLYLNSFGSLPICRYPMDGQNANPGAALLTAANADLKWETVVTKNAGIDIGILNNRLNISFELFQRNNIDMLLRKSVPLTVGYMISDAGQELGDGALDTRPLVNYGTLDNRGWEATVIYKDKAGDFNFEVNANITSAITIIEDIGDPLYAGSGRGLSNVCRTVNGQPVSAFYGYEIEGMYTEDEFTWFMSKAGKWQSYVIDPEGAQTIKNLFTLDGTPVVATTTLANAKPGYFKYKDQITEDTDGDGKADAVSHSIGTEDIVMIGDPNPDFIFGFGGNMEYKGFDMNFFFQGSYGNDIYNMLKVNSFNANNGGLNWDPSLINSYVPAQYNTSDKKALPVETSAARNTETGMPRMDCDLSSSTFYIEDGSYLRLKNIQIGYTLPSSVTSKIKMERLRIYVGAKNLLTFTKYTGFDPEVGETSLLERGFDRGTYPQSKMFTFGINASF